MSYFTEGGFADKDSFCNMAAARQHQRHIFQYARHVWSLGQTGRQTLIVDLVFEPIWQEHMLPEPQGDVGGEQCCVYFVKPDVWSGRDLSHTILKPDL